MLELLAGPFDFRDSDGALLSPSIANGGPETVWDDDVGLISHMTIGGLACYTVTQMDGLTYPRSTYDRARPLVLDVPGAKLLSQLWLFRDALLEFDKFAGTYGATLTSGGTNYVREIMARVPDRYLRAMHGRIDTMTFAAPNVLATEYTFAGSLGTYATISRTEEDDLLCVVWSETGVVTYYNYVTKQEVRARQYIPPHLKAWYSPRHDVFVLVDTEKRINVYAVTARPDALSAPEALTPITRGRKSILRVRLTGSNGEVCPAERIDWSLAGAGLLGAAQSLTNLDGYATVDYYAPLDLPASPTITAGVTF